MISAGVVEASRGTWIMITRRVVLAWIVSSATFAGFSVALWRHLWTGDAIACGCLLSDFGSVTGRFESALRASLLWIGCVLAALAAALRRPSITSPDRASPAREMRYANSSS
jgi:hypothetical protein